MATDEPRWLSSEEQQVWRALTSLLIGLPTALDAQLKRDSDLSHFEYGVMAMLSEKPDCTFRMSGLADMTDASLSRLSHVVSRLEKRGWVKRKLDPQDGRFTLATLTKDGFNKVVASAPGHVNEVRRLVMDPLTNKQQEQLREIAKRISESIGPDDVCS